MLTYKSLSLDKVDSTQKYCLELATQGKLSHGLIVTANEQSDGIGRHGRTWHSPNGNLYMTLCISPQAILQDWPLLSFVTAISLTESIVMIDNTISVHHKWVNDIMVNDKKLSGILLTNVENKFLLIGVGVNIIKTNELEGLNAISLNELSKKFTKEALLDMFLKRFEINYQLFCEYGFEPIRSLWLKRAYKLGDMFSISMGDSSISGVFVAVDSEGKIELLSNKKIHKISAGEVLLRTPHISTGQSI